MEKKSLREIVNYSRYLIYRMWGIRFVTFIIMLAFFMDWYLAPFRDNVRLFGEDGNVVVLPFLQTSTYFMKLAFLGIVYFYSNVPFMEKEEFFYVNRLGKKRWNIRNIYYIVISAGVLTFSFLVISIIEIQPVCSQITEWGSVFKTLSLTNGKGLKFMLPYQIIKSYSSWELLVIILLLDWLVIMLLGLLMYAVSLIGTRIIASIVATLVVFMPSMDVFLGGRFIFFSPLAWLNCSKWRIGYEPDKPGLSYIIVALIFLNILLIIFCHKRAGKMEWKNQED